IVIGSESDLDIMKETEKILDQFGISYEMRIISAHRTPEIAAEYSKSASSRGISVIVAGAGLAAHLAGAIAANTILPVIGVPLNASSLGGYESLLSTVMMPPGVPVAAVAIGKPGATNAGILAAQILALSDDILKSKIEEYKITLKDKVIEKDTQLKNKS
ncbi:5-(carboxyamino)imidazole ribonucleotide mutase, partial [bacterium]|nr:5-(carboxyamino)imidazole ribonucleotide mutase [bacterium]